MLLESALADISIDAGPGIHGAQQRSNQGAKPIGSDGGRGGKKAPVKVVGRAGHAVSPPKTKHAIQLNLRLPPAFKAASKQQQPQQQSQQQQRRLAWAKGQLSSSLESSSRSPPSQDLSSPRSTASTRHRSPGFPSDEKRGRGPVGSSATRSLVARAGLPVRTAAGKVGASGGRSTSGGGDGIPSREYSHSNGGPQPSDRVSGRPSRGAKSVSPAEISRPSAEISRPSADISRPSVEIPRPSISPKPGSRSSGRPLSWESSARESGIIGGRGPGQLPVSRAAAGGHHVWREGASVAENPLPRSVRASSGGSSSIMNVSCDGISSLADKPRPKLPKENVLLQRQEPPFPRAAPPPQARVISTRERTTTTSSAAAASAALGRSLNLPLTRAPPARAPAPGREIRPTQQARGKSSAAAALTTPGPPPPSQPLRGSHHPTLHPAPREGMQTKSGLGPIVNVPKSHILGGDGINSLAVSGGKTKYDKELSPVSTLERLPSPPATNSSAASGGSSSMAASSSHTLRTASSSSSSATPVAAPGEEEDLLPAPASSLPGLALARRSSLPSFSSSSQSSPPASTSSSTRYAGHCLRALQAALAADPERSRRFEDSFVELDTPAARRAIAEAAGAPGPDSPESYVTVASPVFFPDTRLASPVWASGRSELEPEYSAMDLFYSDDNATEDYKDSASPMSSSAGAESSSSFVSWPIRRSLRLSPQVSVEDYSVKDRRFLSAHPSSWVHRGDDSSSSGGGGGGGLGTRPGSRTNRHEDVSWDEQQAVTEDQLDPGADRAEEVVRGAVDGLRFTYSPVSSAFVFARSKDEEDESDDEGGAARRRRRHSRGMTAESAMSMLSLDDASSICSDEEGDEDEEDEEDEDYYYYDDVDDEDEDDDDSLFRRNSDVTELAASQAESWSNVSRGWGSSNVFQQRAVAVLSPPRMSGEAVAVENSAVGERRRSAVLNGNNDSALQESSAGSNPSPPAAAKSRGFRLDCKESRLIRRRPSSKKSSSATITCLPFRSILRNFKPAGSPGRSRLGQSSNDGQLRWASPAGNRSRY